MVAKVKLMREAARPVCEEIVAQIASRDETRDTIRASPAILKTSSRTALSCGTLFR